jgi:hypothetical protein
VLPALWLTKASLFCFGTADNEELQVLWVGQSASPQLLLDLFGVDDIFKVDIRIVRAPILSDQLNVVVSLTMTRRSFRFWIPVSPNRFTIFSHRDARKKAAA